MRHAMKIYLLYRLTQLTGDGRTLLETDAEGQLPRLSISARALFLPVLGGRKQDTGRKKACLPLRLLTGHCSGPWWAFIVSSFRRSLCLRFLSGCSLYGI